MQRAGMCVAPSNRHGELALRVGSDCKWVLTWPGLSTRLGAFKLELPGAGGA